MLLALGTSFEAERGVAFSELTPQRLLRNIHGNKSRIGCWERVDRCLLFGLTVPPRRPFASSGHFHCSSSTRRHDKHTIWQLQPASPSLTLHTNQLIYRHGVFEPMSVIASVSFRLFWKSQNDGSRSCTSCRKHDTTHRLRKWIFSFEDSPLGCVSSLAPSQLTWNNSAPLQLDIKSIPNSCSGNMVREWHREARLPVWNATGTQILKTFLWVCLVGLFYIWRVFVF